MALAQSKNRDVMKTSQAVRLSTSDRALLRVLEHRGEDSFCQLARLIGSRESQVRYRFHGLRERGVILDRRPFVDMYAIGLSVFKFYVELVPEKRSQLQQVVTHLKRHPSVMWIAQLGGNHQLVFSLCAGDISGVYRFQRDLLAELGAIFLSIDLLVQVQFTAFGRRYLDPSQSGGPRLTFGCSQRPAVKIDQQDHKILVALSSGEFKSDNSMAREIDIPLTTVRRRLKALESAGVIRGYIYRYNLSPIGMLRFNLLVSIRGLDTTLPERMVAFCSRQTGIVNVGECIGAWQFEITTDVVRPSDTEEILQALYAEFPAEILNVRTVPVFQSYKYASYPGKSHFGEN